MCPPGVFCTLYPACTHRWECIRWYMGTWKAFLFKVIAECYCPRVLYASPGQVTQQKSTWIGRKWEALSRWGYPFSTLRRVPFRYGRSEVSGKYLDGIRLVAPGFWSTWQALFPKYWQSPIIRGYFIQVPVKYRSRKVLEKCENRRRFPSRGIPSVLEGEYQPGTGEVKGTWEVLPLQESLVCDFPTSTGWIFFVFFLIFLFLIIVKQFAMSSLEHSFLLFLDFLGLPTNHNSRIDPKNEKELGCCFWDMAHGCSSFSLHKTIQISPSKTIDRAHPGEHISFFCTGTSSEMVEQR